MDAPATGRKPSTRKGLVAWCLFDWANSAYPTVITTFVFAAYFTKAVAVDVVSGTAQWGWTASVAALAVALAGPVLGAIADHSGRRKPWILAFTVIAALASALLWSVTPEPGSILRALVLVGIASFAFEMGMVFYNAMLPDLAPAAKIGRWSGWGWGLGYIGGLACLAITLVAFVQADVPWFGLDPEAAEHLRATGPLVAAWMLVFALPLFLYTPDRAPGARLGEAARRGMVTLMATFTHLRAHANVGRFLLARMIYTDGLNTLFAFGGIYAAGSFGFSFEDLILFGIGINLTAGLGAAGFAWVDDWIGPKRTILIAVTALSLLSSCLLIIESVTLFWVFGLSLGIFVGPAQSASRSMMARMAPVDMRTEMFGLYALSGKATAFLGPALLALTTDAFTSQRAGMASILIFFLVGGLLLLRVREK
ncbi:MAG: MFS transporter [Rhodospirillales bacterium]|nr:MFS transporter [Rhodospirillales bacterium]